jgi:RNA polymerase sigma factor (sigma-70 family)
MTTEPQENAELTALSVLLDAAVPPTPMANRVPDSAFREIVQGARWQAKRSRRHRVTPRSVAFGTVLLLTIGGAGTAAAATLSGWEPWAENPDAVVHFTLPGGASCEYRIVAKDTGNPEAVASPSDENLDVRAALDKLDADLSELVRLLHWDGFTISEAARILDVPASTARSRYQKAKRELSRLLTPTRSS